MIEQIEATNLDDTIRSGRTLALLDVREPWEFELARIPGSVNVPMSAIASRIEDVRALQSDQAMVLICHHGARSMHVAQFLATQGFDDLINLRGGIDAWSTHVDRSVPTY